ncbi:sulfatase-like hydrolase/transferase [Novipirellula artificiosorum]|uniref:Arylsulfatase n=1 Tax=Novipirellula artificiosorum TaxID=2528016 RepID=A0A5C6D5V1_9BACT|nr:sulfatase-like hydrolase/transferase [Novipirellula artificiosorum]TWU32543.1 Arylsulfatase [Novipirellula artificiosorum]
MSQTVNVIAAAVGVVVGLTGLLAGAENAPPNVLLIYVDDLGYNDLGCYGAQDPGIKTPNIDRLAADGIRLSNYLSACSVCSPSRGALLTGRYPQRNGLPVCPNDKPEHTDWYEHVGLPQSEITIAELLGPLGYATAAYGKWHLGDADKFAPRKQGFDEYVGRKHNFHVGKPGVWFHNEEPQGEIMFREAHQKLTDATIAFMKQQREKEKPFFIYLAHYLVHGPWSPNKEFCTAEQWASVEKRKGGMNPTALPAMVRELDHHVGRVLASLKQLDIENETLVIFASDNGPWLPAGSAYPLSGWKYTTMEGGHRVPAIVRWPGTIPAGQVSDQMVSALDVLPTIAAATGASLPVDRKFDGYNVMPMLSGKTDKSPRQEFAYYNGLTLEAIRRGPWKLHLPRQAAHRVYWAQHPKKTYMNLDHAVLNHLGDDISEKQDLTQSVPEQTKELQKLAAKIRLELGDWNREGTDRPEYSYPGNLNNPNWKQ